MSNRFIFSLVFIVLGLITAARAAEPADAAVTPEQFEASLKLQSGKIALPNGLATLDLPANFRYLGPAEAERVLVEGWGNPPGMKSLGMIVPANTRLLSAAGWGVIVTYEADGHVPDDEADKIKYDELLKEMQEQVLENNAERKKQGYGTMTLVGWAETPSYDKTSHKLYWAKELKTEGASVPSLNYNIRVLGREGVLVLNAIAGMDQIAEIKREMKTVTAFSDFTPGNRYADFNAETDKTAEYGLAALVAGGIAGKLGLFGKLLALLIAFKKLIIIGAGAAGVALFRFIRGKSGSKVNLEK
jgi:uncharacterized membrane-anchored protein